MAPAAAAAGRAARAPPQLQLRHKAPPAPPAPAPPPALRARGGGERRAGAALPPGPSPRWAPQGPRCRFGRSGLAALIGSGHNELRAAATKGRWQGRGCHRHSAPLRGNGGSAGPSGGTAPCLCGDSPLKPLSLPSSTSFWHQKLYRHRPVNKLALTAFVSGSSSLTVTLLRYTLCAYKHILTLFFLTFLV